MSTNIFLYGILHNTGQLSIKKHSLSLSLSLSLSPDLFPLISDDLVNSHYLLLCCLDMLCAAAITSKRKDILNPDFPGLPEGFESPSFTTSEDFPRILPELCSQFSGTEKARFLIAVTYIFIYKCFYNGIWSSVLFKHLI